MVRRTRMGLGIVFCAFACEVLADDVRDLPRPPAASPATRPATPSEDGDVTGPIVDLDLRLISIDSETVAPAIQAALGTEFSTKVTNRAAIAATLTPEKLKNLIEVCQADRRSNILCTPRMTLTLGRKGQLRSGGEIAIPAAKTGDKADANDSPIQMRFFGTAVDVTVTQPKPGILRVELDLEQSNLVPSAESDGVPDINSRKIETNVELKTGESLLLRGGQEQRQVGTETRVPILAELPVVGDLFTKRKVEKSTNELLLLVTPRLLEETAR